MSKFKVGDRVAIYSASFSETSGRVSGTIASINDEMYIYVRMDKPDLALGASVWKTHAKQLRKLKKKAKPPTFVVPTSPGLTPDMYKDSGWEWLIGGPLIACWVVGCLVVLVTGVAYVSTWVYSIFNRCWGVL